MTPDTLRIDVRIRGVGRIAKASGTFDKGVRRSMVKMLRALSPERLDILRAIRDGQIDIVDVYGKYKANALHELPIGDAMPKIVDRFAEWIEDSAGKYSAHHIVSLETSCRYFVAARPDARIADLPDVLDALRKTLGRKHPRSFSLARAAALAFTRSVLKRNHPVYQAVLAVEDVTVKRKVTKVRITPASFFGFFPNPDADTKAGKVDRIAWSMAFTGMGQKELWGGWSIEADRVHIYGTKRGGRVRDIPLTYPPAVPRLSRDRFEKNFRERMHAAGITPYHLRRTFIQWLEAAGIPRTRRRIYAGHGTKDVTDLYEAHEITDYLAGDAIKLRAYLTLPEPPKAGGSIEIVK